MTARGYEKSGWLNITASGYEKAASCQICCTKREPKRPPGWLLSSLPPLRGEKCPRSVRALSARARGPAKDIPQGCKRRSLRKGQAQISKMRTLPEGSRRCCYLIGGNTTHSNRESVCTSSPREQLGRSSANTYVHSNFFLTVGQFLVNFERPVLDCIEADFCKT